MGEAATLKRRELADIEAEALMHDVFAEGPMPVRLLPAVSENYFEPQLAEFEPRNAWSLHNAFTIAVFFTFGSASRDRIV